MESTLRIALDSALKHLDGLDSRSVAATTGLATLRERLGRELSAEGMAPDAVIRELAAAVDGGSWAPRAGDSLAG